MKIEKRVFGQTKEGRDVLCWRIDDEKGMCAEILDYGVTIRSLIVPDGKNEKRNVVLGYDSMEQYEALPGFRGAVMGRFANRIGGASFELNGKRYELAANDGKNHLHGGFCGFDRKIWDSKAVENGVRFRLFSPDGEEGYPGNLKVQVDVIVKNGALELLYQAETDEDTVLNLTNHCFFNLDEGNTVKDHLLMINSDRYLVNDAACLPTGEIRKVDGTAMDFRQMRRLGDGIEENAAEIRLFGGYDHNFILDQEGTAVMVNQEGVAAMAYSPKSKILMTMHTDQPGVQLFNCNDMGMVDGKAGKKYGNYSAFCLETQHYPDCVHHKEWSSAVLRKGEKFESRTAYIFSVRDEMEDY